jgi:hypothetical protein
MNVFAHPIDLQSKMIRRRAKKTEPQIEKQTNTKGYSVEFNSHWLYATV